MAGDIKSENSSSFGHVAKSVRGRSDLTQEAFDRFLERMSPDRGSAGVKYLEVHKNLVRFFEWRGCPYPEDHADEAISRVAKRLAQGEEIRDPATYVIGVARLLLLEVYKELEKQRLAVAELADVPQSSASQSESLERRVECLRRCLEKLPPDNRELILQYYEGEKSVKIRNRKELTERLQLSVNTLRMRALRIRERLLECVETCVSQVGAVIYRQFPPE